MKKKLIIAAVATLGALLVLVFGMNIQYDNREARLRNQASAQQDANKVVFDKVWKVLQQKAQVTDQYKDAFAKIYPELMEGRYGNERGGALLSMITESNPNFDVSLYKDLMTSIEAQREGFARVQIALRDIKREHDDLRTTAPANWFVNAEELKVVLVTSGKTDEAFSTGREEDVDLFGKKKE